MSRSDLYGSVVNSQAVGAKELLIPIGREAGGSFPELSKLNGLEASTVSCRYEAAKRKLRIDTKLAFAKGPRRKEISRKYCGIADLTLILPLVYQRSFFDPLRI